MKQWPFKVGDEVQVRFRVVHVHEHDRPWSLTLETLHGNPGTDGFPSTVTLCSNIVEPKPRIDWVSWALLLIAFVALVPWDQLFRWLR